MATGAVSARVRGARRARLALTAGECLLVAVSAAWLTLAAAAASGAPAGGFQPFAAAGLSAAFAAAAWIGERDLDAESVAREMDLRSGLRGALFTAFEAEARGSASPLVQVLGAEIAPRLSVRAFVREAARSSALLLAAPCVALALWTFSLESRGEPGRAGSGAGAAELGGNGPVRSSRGGDARPSAAPPSGVGESARPEVPRPSPSAPDARESRDAGAAPRRDADPGVTSGVGEGTMAGPDARIERSPDASMKPSNTTAGAVPSAPPTSSPSGASAAGTEGGVAASRWWPRRYDSVVERWIESQRAARGGRPR